MQNSNCFFLLLDYAKEKVVQAVAKHTDRLREIGLKVAYYRKLRGFTQEQLAEMLGKSTSHVGAIEAANVERAMSINTLFDIADLLEIPPYKFFLFDDEIPIK